MTQKKSKINSRLSEEEQQLFRSELADVRPLTSDERVETVKKHRSPAARRHDYLTETDPQSTTETLSDPVALSDVEIEDTLFFARPGIQQKVQRKLRRGEFQIEDELDLHGYTVAEAKTAIIEFIDECKNNHIRYIRIIHGKGYRSEQKIPRLKTHVAYWLPQHRDVIAFSSAQAKDGGTGALYVILKVVRSQ